MSKTIYKKTVDGFSIKSPQTTPIDDVPKFNMLKNEGFLSVWIEGNHTFIVMFPSPKFKKLIISDRRPNSCKIVPFGGF